MSDAEFTEHQQAERLAQAFVGARKSTRQWARWVMTHRSEFMAILMDAKIITPVTAGDYRDSSGKQRAAFWVVPAEPKCGAILQHLEWVPVPQGHPFRNITCKLPAGHHPYLRPGLVESGYPCLRCGVGPEALVHSNGHIPDVPEEAWSRE